MAKNIAKQKTADIIEMTTANIVKTVGEYTDNQAVMIFATGIAIGVSVTVAAVKIGAEIAMGNK